MRHRAYVEGKLPIEGVEPQDQDLMVLTILNQLHEEFGASWFRFRTHLGDGDFLQVWFDSDIDADKLNDRLQHFYATGGDDFGHWEFSFDYRDVS